MKLSVPARVATACASLMIATSPLHAVSIDDATANVGAARSAIAGSGAAESDVAALEAFLSGGRVAPGADFTKVGSLRQRQALKAALVELRGARAEAARLEAERAKPKKCYTMSCNDYAEDLGEGRKLWQANDRLTGAINENAAPFSF